MGTLTDAPSLPFSPIALSFQRIGARARNRDPGLSHWFTSRTSRALRGKLEREEETLIQGLLPGSRYRLALCSEALQNRLDSSIPYIGTLTDTPSLPFSLIALSFPRIGKGI